MSRDERASARNRKIKILIIEDHGIVRAGLRMLLENDPSMEVVGEASKASEVRAAAEMESPDIILLDLDLGDENGIDFVSDVLARFARARVLVLTATSDTGMHLQAVAAGASGVVIKEQAPEMLLKAIQRVHAGEAWLARSLASAVVGRFSRSRNEVRNDPEAERIAFLTPREREVLGLILKGLNGDRIASQLRISEGTVRNHLTSILSKLQLSNRFELVVFAFRHGLGAGDVTRVME
jgi:DNA-binding NarL/FixJ family response regulator